MPLGTILLTSVLSLICSVSVSMRSRKFNASTGFDEFNAQETWIESAQAKLEGSVATKTAPTAFVYQTFDLQTLEGSKTPLSSTADQLAMMQFGWQTLWESDTSIDAAPMHVFLFDSKGADAVEPVWEFFTPAWYRGLKAKMLALCIGLAISEKFSTPAIFSELDVQLYPGWYDKTMQCIQSNDVCGMKEERSELNTGYFVTRYSPAVKEFMYNWTHKTLSMNSTTQMFLKGILHKFKGKMQTASFGPEVFATGKAEVTSNSAFHHSIWGGPKWPLTKKAAKKRGLTIDPETKLNVADVCTSAHLVAGWPVCTFRRRTNGSCTPASDRFTSDSTSLATVDVWKAQSELFQSTWDDVRPDLQPDLHMVTMCEKLLALGTPAQTS